MTLERPSRPWDRTPPKERGYFEVLGDGILCHVLPRDRTTGGGGGGWSPPSGGAWVHVGADGRIRAFTGKAEVGQGTRTALSLVVAEELRVPVARVELTMADTDLSPWDMGTFGSRSMPDAVPPLQAAAARAREELASLAAARLLVSAGQVRFEDGVALSPEGGHRVTYGELVRGLRKTVVASTPGRTTPAADWKTAGQPAVDPAAADVVTGRRVYASDVRRPGMWYGVVLLPPNHGAELASVDTSALEGEEEVRLLHDGPFVAVAAPTPWDARRALRKVRAIWRSTPQPGEPEIEAYLRAHPSHGDHWDVEKLAEGDPARALAEAAVSVKATYLTAYIAHVPLEPRAAVAEWEGDRVTIWLGSQTPFRGRDHVAGGLGIPPERVRVIVPFTGAGFGGKHGGDVALAAARLSKAAGRPVRVAFTREEEFQHGYLRPMSIVDVAAGATKDGLLTAWTFHNVNGGAAGIRSPYSIPNLQADNELSDSPLPQGPYRALAANANNFARESTVDELASLVGQDPVAFREKNLADERLRTVLRTAAERGNWTSWRPSPGRGHGIAVGFEKGGRVATVAEVTLGPDRRPHVDRLLTVFEAGAIVHPDNLQSQVEGATVMALGGALFEEIHFDGGVITNRRLSEYRVPRFSDLPRVEVVLLDRKDLPPGGAGETPMIAVAPAVASAIHEASGVRLRSLPLLRDGKVPAAPRSPAT